MEKLISPNDIIGSGLCIGCGSCAAQYSANGVTMQFDKYGELKPQGQSEWFDTPSQALSATCPFSPLAINEDQIALQNFPNAAEVSTTIGRYELAYVGFSKKDSFRKNGSSGGMVSWVASALLERGLIDGLVHVAAPTTDSQSPLFSYRISSSLDEIAQGAKSRYYPTEMADVLKLIADSPGRYAVVGIPCFIKAVHLLRATYPVFKERIPYTLGLFCGHMKSSKMVESFAMQAQLDFKSVSSIDFRSKKEGRPANLYFAKFFRSAEKPIEKNWELMADGDWGAGFFMNQACNFCDDVVSETADISFGDAWIEPYSSDYRGTNVVIVRNRKLQDLIEAGLAADELSLTVVDAAFIEKTQAAGIRHRREGLSFRLAKRSPKIALKKRVAPRYRDIPLSRRIGYGLRYSISFWSHKMYLASTNMKQPRFYLVWAKVIGAVYQKIIYHRVMLATVLMGLKGLFLALMTNVAISLFLVSPVISSMEYHSDVGYHAVGYPIVLSLFLIPAFIGTTKKHLKSVYFDLFGISLTSAMILLAIYKSAWPYAGLYSIFVVTNVILISRFLKQPVS
jgi:coenzyme F420-reducing hydrogenase beta subunit